MVPTQKGETPFIEMRSIRKRFGWFARAHRRARCSVGQRLLLIEAIRFSNAAASLFVSPPTDDKNQ
jgi:hypothetical protein